MAPWANSDNFCLRLKTFRIHLKLRDFICKTCGKGFNGKEKLHEHRLQHRGIKYHCFVEGCSSKAKFKANMWAHMRQLHKLNQKELDDCKAKLDKFYADNVLSEFKDCDTW